MMSTIDKIQQKETPRAGFRLISTDSC